MKQTILVVEDEPDVMNLLRHILKHYNLIEATNADQALRLAARLPNRIALLVADVHLSKSSGISVALHLRTQYPRLPVLLTSGYAVSNWSNRDTADLAKLGSDSVAIIHKPFQALLLRNTVRALTEQTRAGIARPDA